MQILGIVGGIASGKSVVARHFETLGAVRLDADGAGHAVLEEPAVKQALVGRWGPQVLDAAGRTDRGAIGRIVFAGTEDADSEKRFLEQLTHPRIAARLQSDLEAARQQHRPAAVLDAALMIEAGWDQLCDHLVFVEASREQRLQRALERGWTESEFQRREATQLSLDVKRARADSIIDNSGTLRETHQQAAAVWELVVGPLSGA